MAARADRLAGALWGLYAGDAIAMPVHWYYDVGQIARDFGAIDGYRAPKERLRGSILSLSSTSGGGRGGVDGPQVIGDVINHGKRQYWERGANYFYHCTLQQGENTLEAQLTRVAVRTMASNPGGKFDRDAFVKNFVTFMTTPGSHNDVYASTYLRMFFKEYSGGVPVDKCPGNDGHNVDTIDALTTCGAVAAAAWARGDSRDDAADAVEKYLRSTRRSDVLPRYGALYTDMLYALLNSPEDVSPAAAVRSAAEALAAKLKIPLLKLVAAHPGNTNPMTACYMGSALPAALIILHKYADDPAKCLFASANAGGENVARGSVLGTVLGAAYGKSGLPEWMVSGLCDTVGIAAEIDALQAAVAGPSKSGV